MIKLLRRKTNLQSADSGALGVNSGAVTPWYLSGGIALANCVAAYQPKGAASLAASYVNLANPGTYDCTLGVAPTLGANGWDFAKSQYLRTGILPVAVTWSMLVAFGNSDGLGIQQLAGCFKSYPTAFFNIASSVSGTSRVYANGSNFLLNAGRVTSGVMGLAGFGCYKDGVSDGTIVSSSATTGLEIYIGARNENGTANGFFGGYIKGIAIYNSTLTAAQVSALSTAMAAL